ncbi:MAG: sugar phosphate isomerase/epimerase [Clostridia bacterium]|nr:sugar phosphate isomerase/epimerase [Clostridia bacterium]
MNQLNIYAFADEASSMIDGQITAMKRNGLQGLEIRGVDGVNISDISIAKAREVHTKLAENGLKVWSIGSPIGKIAIDGDHATHIEKFRRTLEIAQALHAENIRLFSYYIDEGKDPADYRNAVIDHLGKLLSYGEGSGIRLCHENEKGIYGDNAARCRELLDTFPQLFGIFDPANFVQCGQDTLEGWKLLKDRIFYLHIKDAVSDGTVVPAGYGEGHLKEILADFIARGGTSVTVEPHLQAFSGLSNLERPKEDRKLGVGFHFRDLDESFDKACSSLKEILAAL